MHIIICIPGKISHDVRFLTNFKMKKPNCPISFLRVLTISRIFPFSVTINYIILRNNCTLLYKIIQIFNTREFHFFN